MSQLVLQGARTAFSDFICKIYAESSYHRMINIVVNTKEINRQHYSKPQGGNLQPKATKVPEIE